jgi:hypothetical protein
MVAVVIIFHYRYNAMYLKLKTLRPTTGNGGVSVAPSKTTLW